MSRAAPHKARRSPPFTRPEFTSAGKFGKANFVQRLFSKLAALRSPKTLNYYQASILWCIPMFMGWRGGYVDAYFKAGATMTQLAELFRALKSARYLDDDAATSAMHYAPHGAVTTHEIAKLCN